MDDSHHHVLAALRRVSCLHGQMQSGLQVFHLPDSGKHPIFKRQDNKSFQRGFFFVQFSFFLHLIKTRNAREDTLGLVQSIHCYLPPPTDTLAQKLHVFDTLKRFKKMYFYLFLDSLIFYCLLQHHK